MAQKGKALADLLALVDGPETTDALRARANSSIRGLESLSVLSDRQRLALDRAHLNREEADKLALSTDPPDARRRRVRYAAIIRGVEAAGSPALLDRALEYSLSHDVTGAPIETIPAEVVGEKVKDAAGAIYEAAKDATSGGYDLILYGVVAYAVTRGLR